VHCTFEKLFIKFIDIPDFNFISLWYHPFNLGAVFGLHTEKNVSEHETI
jgi:hypothetical protein